MRPGCVPRSPGEACHASPWPTSSARLAAGWDGCAPAQVALARALYDDRHHSVAEIYTTLGIARPPLSRRRGGVSQKSGERADGETLITRQLMRTNHRGPVPHPGDRSRPSQKRSFLRHRPGRRCRRPSKPAAGVAPPAGWRGPSGQHRPCLAPVEVTKAGVRLGRIFFQQAGQLGCPVRVRRRAVAVKESGRLP